jgi:hypothetical protein
MKGQYDMKTTLNEMYGEDFFDKDNKELGTFSTYSFESVFPKFKDLTLEVVNNLHPTTVLDAGCGKGF